MPSLSLASDGHVMDFCKVGFTTDQCGKKIGFFDRLRRILGSHSGFEEYHLLGYNAAQSDESKPKFRRTCGFHLQGRRINRARNPAWKQIARTASRWFLVWLILRPCRWRRHVLSKRQLTFNGLSAFYPAIYNILSTTISESLWYRINKEGCPTAYELLGC
jgi:hypothetical protein